MFQQEGLMSSLVSPPAPLFLFPIILSLRHCSSHGNDFSFLNGKRGQELGNSDCYSIFFLHQEERGTTPSKTMSCNYLQQVLPTIVNVALMIFC